MPSPEGGQLVVHCLYCSSVWGCLLDQQVRLYGMERSIFHGANVCMNRQIPDPLKLEPDTHPGYWIKIRFLSQFATCVMMVFQKRAMG
jgi:hypothetical protein